MARIAADDNSERKRISIPKADDSVLAWWDAQKDAGLSVRLLVRNEIERNGYTDAAFRPVTQLPRRGRPPVFGIDGIDDTEDADDAETRRVAFHTALAAQGGKVFTMDDARPDAPAVLDPRQGSPSLQQVAPEPQPVTAAAPVLVQAAPVRTPELVSAIGRSAIDDIMNG